MEQVYDGRPRLGRNGGEGKSKSKPMWPIHPASGLGSNGLNNLDLT
jgi:hypothetical protein